MLFLYRLIDRIYLHHSAANVFLHCAVVHWLDKREKSMKNNLRIDMSVLTCDYDFDGWSSILKNTSPLVAKYFHIDISFVFSQGKPQLIKLFREYTLLISYHHDKYVWWIKDIHSSSTEIKHHFYLQPTSLRKSTYKKNPKILSYQSHFYTC